MTLGASVGLPPAGGIDEASGAGCSTDMATQREPIKSHALMPVGLAHVLPGRVPLVGTPLASNCRATPPSIFAGTTLRFSASASTRTAWRLNDRRYDAACDLRVNRCIYSPSPFSQSIWTRTQAMRPSKAWVSAVSLSAHGVMPPLSYTFSHTSRLIRSGVLMMSRGLVPDTV
jgi:hypothetical protein